LAHVCRANVQRSIVIDLINTPIPIHRET